LRSEFIASQFEGVGLNIRRDFWIGSKGNCNTFLGEYNAIHRVSSVLSHSMLAVAERDRVPRWHPQEI